MTKNLIKPDSRKDLSTVKVLYLLNLENGRVFPWTAYLSVKKGFIDCTKHGQPINPADVPGDHPWIKEQTEGLRDRLSHAGKGVGMSVDSIDHLLTDVGRQLTEDGNAKFKSLEYKHAKTLKLESAKSASQVGALVRIQKKIDKMAAATMREIDQMAYKFRVRMKLL
jgi:hypothetical protein